MRELAVHNNLLYTIFFIIFQWYLQITSITAYIFNQELLKCGKTFYTVSLLYFFCILCFYCFYYYLYSVFVFMLLSHFFSSGIPFISAVPILA